MKQLLVVMAFVMLLLVCSLIAHAEISESEWVDRVVDMQNEFPNGTIWTHDGGENGYRGIAWQCHGFALYAANRIFGAEDARQWPRVYDVNQLKRGDIVRRSSSSGGHTFVVQDVIGDTIVFFECNWNYKNGVEWYREISKSSLSSVLEYILSSPGVNSNSRPEMAFDGVGTSPGKFTVKGWAFDPDDTSASLNIHVYVWDANGKQIYVNGSTVANRDGSDVDEVYHCGKNHRFEATFTVNFSGTVKIGVAALDTTTGGEGATWQYKEGVNIPKDSEAPKISNERITSINSSSFTLSATITDNIELSKVQFPYWHTWNPGPIATFMEAKKKGDIYSLTVNRDLSKMEYWMDFYAWDYQNNVTESAIRAHICWEIVTYDANGGLVSPKNNLMVMARLFNKNTSKVVSYYTTYGKYGLPEPIRAGYSFEGWYTDKTWKKKITNTSNIEMIGNHTLYARWKPVNTIKLTALLNHQRKGTLNNIATVDLYINGVRVGDDISEWYASYPDGTSYEIKDIKTQNGINYNGVSHGNLSGIIDKYMAVRMDFTTTPDVITLEAGDGIVEPHTIFAQHKYFYPVLPVPKRDGYIFGGWVNEKGNMIDHTMIKTDKGDEVLSAIWYVVPSTLPAGLLSVEERAFSGAGLCSVRIPNTVERIEMHAFDDNVVIFGEKGSAAELYCLENNLRFIADEDNGWKTVENGWKYYKDGQYIMNRWLMLDKHWYFFNENGFLVTESEIGDYYVDASGICVYDGWANGHYYGSDGKRNKEIENETTGEWKINEIGWWFEYEDGTYPKSVWKEIDKDVYCFDDKGYMKQNVRLSKESHFYYFGNQGWMCKDVWINQYYYDENGVENNQYVLVPEGDWIEDDNGWWYLNKDKSWPILEWLWIDDNEDGIAECYYFDRNGYMARNTIIDGWKVNGNGAWYVENAVQTRKSVTDRTFRP